jgi:hypothetical protein
MSLNLIFNSSINCLRRLLAMIKALCGFGALFASFVRGVCLDSVNSTGLMTFSWCAQVMAGSESGAGSISDFAKSWSSAFQMT